VSSSAEAAATQRYGLLYKDSDDESCTKPGGLLVSSTVKGAGLRCVPGKFDAHSNMDLRKRYECSSDGSTVIETSWFGTKCDGKGMVDHHPAALWAALYDGQCVSKSGGGHYTHFRLQGAPVSLSDRPSCTLNPVRLQIFLRGASYEKLMEGGNGPQNTLRASFEDSIKEALVESAKNKVTKKHIYVKIWGGLGPKKDILFLAADIVAPPGALTDPFVDSFYRNVFISHALGWNMRETAVGQDRYILPAKTPWLKSLESKVAAGAPSAVAANALTVHMVVILRPPHPPSPAPAPTPVPAPAPDKTAQKWVPGVFGSADGKNFEVAWCPDNTMYRRIKVGGIVLYSNRKVTLHDTSAAGVYHSDFEALEDAWTIGPESVEDFSSACPQAGFTTHDAKDGKRRVIPAECYDSASKVFGPLTLGHTTSCRTWYETIKFDGSGAFTGTNGGAVGCQSSARRTDFDNGASMVLPRPRSLTEKELSRCSQNLGVNFWE